MSLDTPEVITDTAELRYAVRRLTGGPFLGFDVETLPAPGQPSETRGDTWRNNVTWISLATDTYACVIPMGHPNGAFIEAVYPLRKSADLTARLAKGLSPRKSDFSTNAKLATLRFEDPPDQLDRTEVFAALRPLFMDEDLIKVGHNLAFDLGAVAKYLGGIPAGPYADTMIAAFLLDSSKGYGFDLKSVAKKYADITVVKGVGKEIEKHAFDEVARYSALDVVATVKTWMVMEPLIERDALQKVFALEMDVLPVVTQMRLTGAHVDVAALEELRDRLDVDIEKAKGEIFRLAGETFNINSLATKQRLLYGPKEEGGRGLKPVLLTDGGKKRQREGQTVTIADYSVANDALEKYRATDRLVDALMTHADFAKLHSTYVLPYLGGVTKREVGGKMKDVVKVALLDRGRLHTDFNQIGAATGRFSSRNPNLQNVPNPSTEYGRMIRNLFIAPEGHRLVVADYSQIEPRMIASFSKDPVMLATYRDGGDIYTTIGDIMGVDRKHGKVLVLSIAYGVMEDNIANQIGCSVAEAKNLMDEFADKFKNVGRLKQLTIKTAKSKEPVPFVTTITGRRRYLPDLTSRTWWQVAKAERQAFNTLIQGSAADVMKIALVRASQMVPEGSEVTLTIHDELVTVAPEAQAEETAECIREAMEGVRVLRVPLTADVAIGDSWGAAHK